MTKLISESPLIHNKQYFCCFIIYFSNGRKLKCMYNSWYQLHEKLLVVYINVKENSNIAEYSYCWDSYQHLLEFRFLCEYLSNCNLKCKNWLLVVLVNSEKKMWNELWRKLKCASWNRQSLKFWVWVSIIFRYAKYLWLYWKLALRCLACLKSRLYV